MSLNCMWQSEQRASALLIDGAIKLCRVPRVSMAGCGCDWRHEHFMLWPWNRQVRA